MSFCTRGAALNLIVLAYSDNKAFYSILLLIALVTVSLVETPSIALNIKLSPATEAVLVK